MLERVAVHQTRMRVPGMGLDARGVALGERGLCLFPSIDRLAVFLGLYTREHTLDGLSPTIAVLRSTLGATETALGFVARSSDRMDAVSSIARLAGGFVFTGTSRHFVQYRDARAPFGYDAREILATDASLAIYHSTFSQAYEKEREIDLRTLLTRMAPFPDPTESRVPSECFALAEVGLGRPLLGHLVRGGVSVRVGVGEWPSPTTFEDGSVRRFIFAITELPERMVTLFRTTPGLTLFRRVSPGALVEIGFRHAVTLEATEAFRGPSLTLFRGRGEAPLELAALPALADGSTLMNATVTSFERSTRGTIEASGPSIAVPLRLAPSSSAARVDATVVPTSELGLLRRLAYALGRETTRTTRVAITSRGAFVVADGIERIPLGRFYRRIHARIYVPLGTTVVPAIEPATLAAALASGEDHLLFLDRGSGDFVHARGIAEASFVTLDRALADGASWAPLDASEIAPLVHTAVPSIRLEPLGLRPLAGAEPEEDD